MTHVSTVFAILNYFKSLSVIMFSLCVWWQHWNWDWKRSLHFWTHVLIGGAGKTADFKWDKTSDLGLLSIISKYVNNLVINCNPSTKCYLLHFLRHKNGIGVFEKTVCIYRRGVSGEKFSAFSELAFSEIFRVCSFYEHWFSAFDFFRNANWYHTKMKIVHHGILCIYI